jgi:hypothetical protein
MNFDAVVIGGGAAGLFCAATAGARGRRVAVIEHNPEIGRKILVSGGGRCNFTNLSVSAENFVSENPHFAKSALAGYTPADFVELVRKHRIEYYEKTHGQLFCRDSARRIVAMLAAECDRSRVRIESGCRVEGVERRSDDFEVRTSKGVFRSGKLVIATGGLSFPKIGATDFAYRTARRFGIGIVPTRPALVPLAFAGASDFRRLAGVSVKAVVAAGNARFRENILFTHTGLSGPAILQISNYWKPGVPVNIDLMPDADIARIIESGSGSSQSLVNFLAGYLPKRFSETFLESYNRPVSRLDRRGIEAVSEALKNWKVDFARTEGYHRAEVTGGGVSTSELSSKTMETRSLPGLFFIGEAIDVTGWLGGFNFQWAWSSGFAAANAI